MNERDRLKNQYRPCLIFQLTSTVLMTIADLIIVDAQSGSFATELGLRVARSRPSGAKLLGLVLPVVAVVLVVADPRLPDAVAAGARELVGSAMSRI